MKRTASDLLGHYLIEYYEVAYLLLQDWRQKHKGMLMYHCYILEHEEAGMMGQFEVKKL